MTRERLIVVAIPAAVILVATAPVMVALPPAVVMPTVEVAIAPVRRPMPVTPTEVMSWIDRVLAINRRRRVVEPAAGAQHAAGGAGAEAPMPTDVTPIKAVIVVAIARGWRHVVIAGPVRGRAPAHARRGGVGRFAAHLIGAVLPLTMGRVQGGWTTRLTIRPAAL